MYKLRRTFVFGLVILGLLVCVMLVGCSNKIKGTERKNSPPSISFANVPPESTTFSITPTVYWNATDIDGYIAKYQYAVIVGSSVSDVDSTCNALKRIPPSIWIDSLQSIDPNTKFLSAKETASSIVKVQLFSEQSETDSVRQYLFVRAVDDDDSVSNVIHRMFSRNNHKPKTHINYTSFYTYNTSGVVTGMTSYYSLPETTYTWKGIKIAWEGSDSNDYRGTQPNFLYKWELYGPFEDTISISLDTMALKASGRLVDMSLNQRDSTRFVEDKSLLLPRNNKALVNYPNTVPNYQYPDSGYGWYLFIVWTMDDAFVLSSSLNTTTNSHGHLWFKTIHPQFSYQDVKKILVLDFSNYSGFGTETNEDSIHQFYSRTLSFLKNNPPGAPLCDDTAFSTSLDTINAKDILSRYNLLIYLNEGRPSSGVLGKYVVPYFEDYLKVGGKVWAIGNGASTFGSGLTDNNFIDFTGLSADVGTDFAMNYFGLLGIYNRNWSKFEPNAEFIEARDNNTLNLPDLKMDSVKVAIQLNWATDSLRIHCPPKVPQANYTVLGFAGRIYTFISADSTTSSFHLKPCGSKYEGPLDSHGRPIFKTAHMSFALHLMQEGTDGAIRDSLFKGMVEWFWED